MIQAPFGSTTPAWPGVPSPLAWSQTPTPIGAGMPSAAFGIGAPFGNAPGFAAPEPVTPQALGNPSTGWGSFVGGSPVIAGALRSPFTIPDGVTAPMLMASLAF